MTSKVIASAAIGALVLVFGFGPASQAADCTGHDVLVTETSETMEVGEGHSIMLLKAHSTLVTNDPNNIYNLTMGSCTGTFENFADGTSQGSGHCARTDKDGDTHSLWWSQERGAEKGEWGALSGTGKFAGLEDGGWFQTVAAEGAIFATAFDGACGTN